MPLMLPVYSFGPLAPSTRTHFMLPSVKNQYDGPTYFTKNNEKNTYLRHVIMYGRKLTFFADF